MIKVTFQELAEKLKLIDPTPVVVKFGAEWCAPCKSYGPALTSFSESHPECLVLEVDIDDDLLAAKKFGVHGVPTTILFVSGSEKKRKVGVMSVKNLEEFVE